MPLSNRITLVCGNTVMRKRPFKFPKLISSCFCWCVDHHPYTKLTGEIWQTIKIRNESLIDQTEKDKNKKQ